MPVAIIPWEEIPMIKVTMVTERLYSERCWKTYSSWERTKYLQKKGNDLSSEEKKKIRNDVEKMSIEVVPEEFVIRQCFDIR